MTMMIILKIVKLKIRVILKSLKKNETYKYKYLSLLFSRNFHSVHILSLPNTCITEIQVLGILKYHFFSDSESIDSIHIKITSNCTHHHQDFIYHVFVKAVD